MNILHDIIAAFASREECIIGVCDATPLQPTTKQFTPFVSNDMSKRLNPSAILADAKSIIVLGVPAKIGSFPSPPHGAGILSQLCVAEDYHRVIRKLLKKLATELQCHTNYKIQVDSPNLDERQLAVRAGLGYIGRNGLVISPEYGTRFNIGLLLTNITMDAHKAPTITDSCPNNCNKCIASCPSGALSASGDYDVTRCISYLTQKSEITPEEAKLMGHHLYGCDVCQNACPKNKKQPTPWATPEDWLVMSEGDFTKTYGHTAALWQGTALLRRNAQIVMANRGNTNLS